MIARSAATLITHPFHGTFALDGWSLPSYPCIVHLDPWDRLTWEVAEVLCLHVLAYLLVLAFVQFSQIVKCL